MTLNTTVLTQLINSRLDVCFMRIFNSMHDVAQLVTVGMKDLDLVNLCGLTQLSPGQGMNITTDSVNSDPYSGLPLEIFDASQFWAYTNSPGNGTLMITTASLESRI